MPVALATDGSGGDDNRRKAQAFFSRADIIASKGQYDFAIEMYLSGLAFDPDTVSVHRALRTIALRRKANGGKGKGLTQSMRLRRPTKDDLEAFLNYERLWTFDPGNSDHVLAMLRHACRLNLPSTEPWLREILEKMRGC